MKMADDTDVLLKLYDEQWTQARHIENQRATIANLILVIVSVLVGLSAQRNVGPESLPIAILLIVLGTFGAVTSEKLYERFQYCTGKASYLRARVDELHPTIQLLKLNDISEAKHRKEYPRLSKLRLHHLWLVLFVGIALVGSVLMLVILFQ
jgi:uncharacterized membrane protein YeaQ/YmgE (transglycosylase-associated protein family)